MLTIKKKRPDAGVTGAEAATIVGGPANATAPGVPAAPPGLEPEIANAASGGASAKSYTAFAILGIVLTLCVIAVIALQYTEYAFYQAAPSVWLAK